MHRTGGARSSIAAVLVAASLAWLWATAPPPALAQSARVVSHGDRARHVIALTFDDGTSPANCRRILAILVEQRVPATFFPVAEAMRLDRSFWRLVAAVGDPVGNHTYSHPEMPRLSRARQVSEISRGRNVAEGILGRPTVRVFRPPYGAYNGATLEAARAAGFHTVLLWDTSGRDTSRHGTVAEMVAAAERGSNGSVVLMHCGPNATPYVLRDVISFYRAQGYRFVTIPQLLGIPWSPGRTTTVTREQILDGLTPLPQLDSGGPITGPNGYKPPAPTLVVASPSPPAASAASASLAVTSPDPSLEPSPTISVAAPSESPSASSSLTTPTATEGSLAIVLATLAVIAGAAGAAGLVARGGHRRSHPGSKPDV